MKSQTKTSQDLTKAKIGLEIHVELKTKSKMFCQCDNSENSHPNSSICPICLGYPGVLPVANKQAIEWTIKTGLALNCKINRQMRFDRKHYFYPDLPKGYQISQYDEPIASSGWLKLGTGNNEQGTKKIRIRRVHLEEDTAKLIHPKGAPYSQVDFNRSGTPLIEIVTEPDIETAQEARDFCQKIRQILRYLGVSNADMEKGEMRCEANISINSKSQNPNSKELGTKVEVKNLNSFRSVEKAIDYEIERQKEILRAGGKIKQETRGWDENKQVTFSQRTKETAPDYRYFPEPDLPPFEFSESVIHDLKESLPELPDQRIKRFIEEYQITQKEAIVLTADFRLANYFEEVVHYKINPKKVSSWIITELLGRLNKEGKNLEENPVQAKDLAELIKLIESGKISGRMAKEVFDLMIISGKSPQMIIKENQMEIISSREDLERICKKILQENLSVISDYKKGKTQALQFLIGQIMKETKGRADPKKIHEVLIKEIKKNEKIP